MPRPTDVALTNGSGKDRRRWARKELILHLLVRDADGLELGQVGDLAMGGMALVLQDPREVAVGEVTTLAIELPRGMSATGTLELQAICRWARDGSGGRRRCGLEFVDLSPASRTMLKSLIGRFVGELTWELVHEVHQLVVFLRGSLDEKAPLVDLAAAIEEPVCFDLADLARINSHGAYLWTRFLEMIAHLGPIQLRRCSPPFVSQLVTIENFAGTAEVLSVTAPYLCADCAAEQTVEIPVVGLAAREVKPPPVLCQRCNKPMRFDDLEERYFSFLDPPPTP